MIGRIFESWIETRHAPTLSPGDVVILDNVDFHKSKKAEQLVKAKGVAALPVVLFAGPEPHRNGVLEAQGTLTKASRQKLRGDCPGPWRHHQPLLRHRMQ